METTIQFDPIAIGFDQRSFDAELSKIESLRSHLSDIARELTRLGFDPYTVDLPGLLNSPRRELLTQMPKDFRSMAGNVAGLDLMNWEAQQTLIQLCEESAKKTYFLSYVNFYSLKDGKAELLEEELERLRQHYVIRADTPDKLRRYESAKKLASALTDYCKTHNVTTFHWPNELKHRLPQTFDVVNSKFEVIPKSI